MELLNTVETRDHFYQLKKKESGILVYVHTKGLIDNQDILLLYKGQRISLPLSENPNMYVHAPHFVLSPIQIGQLTYLNILPSKNSVLTIPFFPSPTSVGVERIVSEPNKKILDALQENGFNQITPELLRAIKIQLKRR